MKPERRDIIEKKKSLRELCFSFKEDLESVKSVQDQYVLLYEVQESARKQFHKKLKIGDMIYEISKIFGVSAQTVYRARSAVLAYRTGITPKRYSSMSFKNLQYNIRSR